LGKNVRKPQGDFFWLTLYITHLSACGTYRHVFNWQSANELQTLRIREDTVVSSVFHLGVSMPSTTVSFLLLFGFGTNCRLLCRYVPFHRDLQVSIDGHLGDSDVNLETFVLFLFYTPERFYLSVELGFLVCFLHFMHICHARHYSTLRNVHCLLGSWTCTELSGHWRVFVTVSSFIFFLATGARLSWSHSAFESTLNSSIVSYDAFLCLFGDAVFRSTRTSFRSCETPSLSESWKMTASTRTSSTRSWMRYVKQLSGHSHDLANLITFYGLIPSTPTVAIRVQLL